MRKKLKLYQKILYSLNLILKFNKYSKLKKQKINQEKFKIMLEINQFITSIQKKRKKKNYKINKKKLQVEPEEILIIIIYKWKELLEKILLILIQNANIIKWILNLEILYLMA